MRAIGKITERLARLREIRGGYKRYWHDRVEEEDLHACWDAAIDINLCDYEIKGLEFALAAIQAETGTTVPGKHCDGCAVVHSAYDCPQRTQ